MGHGGIEHGFPYGKSLAAGHGKASLFWVLLFMLAAGDLLAKSHLILPNPDQITIIEPQRFEDLQPGDTIILASGTYRQILIRNLNGNSSLPITLTNGPGEVIITDGPTFGIAIRNSRHLQLLGSPISERPIKIIEIKNGNGISVESFSSDVTIAGFEIRGINKTGIMVKSDPTCDPDGPNRENFLLENVSIHHNLIQQTGDEGLYIGSSFFRGQPIICEGTTLTILPHVIRNLEIFENTFFQTGKDAIQVSSTTENCTVFKNEIGEDSFLVENQQMSGILIGGGTICDVFSNFIENGKGSGIEILGKPGTRVFNNIIINPGRDFRPSPNPGNFAKHGIFVKNVLNEQGFFIDIFNNTIVNPKTNGILIDSPLSQPSHILNNVILNPGAYPTVKDRAFILINFGTPSLKIQSNHLGLNDAGLFAEKNGIVYSPSPTSPLINAGSSLDNFGVNQDFMSQPREVDDRVDIGALEYQEPILREISEVDFQIFPNPGANTLNIEIRSQDIDDFEILIYSHEGKKMLTPVSGIDSSVFISYQLDDFPKGVYKVVLRVKDSFYTKTFIKQ